MHKQNKYKNLKPDLQKYKRKNVIYFISIVNLKSVLTCSTSQSLSTEAL